MDRADDAEVKRPISQPQLSRRAFVVGSLAAGFALAVMPVSADTITTDSNGLVAGEVKIPVEGGEIPAYRAMPANGGPFPTVLVVHGDFWRPRTYQGHLSAPGQTWLLRGGAVALCA
jgi:carboxymethylenebutenolidase